jgi:hypothetical protein
MQAPDGSTISDLVVTVYRKGQANELIAPTSGQVEMVLTERLPALLVDPLVTSIEIKPHALVHLEDKYGNV